MIELGLHINGLAVALEAVERKAGEVAFRLNGKAYRFRGQRLQDGGFLLEEEIAPGLWRRMNGASWGGAKGAVRIVIGGVEASVSKAASQAQGAQALALSPVAPMPSLVRQVLVAQGEKVAKGQALVVVEAMKLQLTLSAGADAVVEAVLVKVGELVAEGAELVRLKEIKS